MTENPRVTDNDKGDITVAISGKELRGWSYASDTERRQKMVQAREFVEGWCDGRDQVVDAIKSTIDGQLNDHLCEMKPDYDDSIVGFNEAWDIVRKVFRPSTSLPSEQDQKR